MQEEATKEPEGADGESLTDYEQFLTDNGLSRELHEWRCRVDDAGYGISVSDANAFIVTAPADADPEEIEHLRQLANINAETDPEVRGRRLMDLYKGKNR